MSKYLLLFIACACSLFSSEERWAHIELGAGNYGLDGHTKISQQKTVLMKITNVSEKPNYIDSLEEKNTGEYNPEDQYGVLFHTLDALVEYRGPAGIFHINDLYEDYALYAAIQLQNYAKRQGYNEVTIEIAPGDYTLLDASKLLSKWGKDYYDSAHLKNPEVSLYHDSMDGNLFSASAISRASTRDLLQKLANLSIDGLHLFILYHKNFVPEEEMIEFYEQGIFYLPSTLEPVPYIFPEGQVIDKSYGRVFFIPHNR